MDKKKVNQTESALLCDMNSAFWVLLGIRVERCMEAIIYSQASG